MSPFPVSLPPERLVLAEQLAQAQSPAVGTGPALAIAVGAITALLALIIGAKMQPVVALLLVSLASALLLGVPVGEVMDTLYEGIGDTLAEVALLVALGAMLGRMLEVSGGASVLAHSLVRAFGERRAPFALGVAALLFGFPIFYDAALIIFLPVVFSVAKALGGSVLRYGLPVAGAFAAIHVFVPPHPGPVAAGSMLGADMGLLVVVGLVVTVPTWLLAGYVFGRRVGDRVRLPVPEVSLAAREDSAQEPANPPGLLAVLSMLVLPLLLILSNTGLETLGEAGAVNTDSTAVQAVQLIGESPIALVIAVLAAVVVLGVRRGMRLGEIERHLSDCLGPIAVVILVTGAGGMFGAVLNEGGVGQALAGMLQSLGVPLLLAAFLIAMVMRVAQGSATVALTTAGGFIAPVVQATPGLSELQLCLVVIAIAAGATTLSHVNDSGFWMTSRLLGMDVPTALRTYTVMQTLIGTIGFLLAALLWVVF
ncbi:GntP family permease [Salinifilum ghardaiensis]